MSRLSPSDMEQGVVEQKYIQARLKSVDVNSIHAAKKVMYGSILLNSAKAKVLFDPSASHSFISTKYVENQKIMKLPSREPLMVHTPRGAMKVEYVCLEVSVVMNGTEFRENLNLLELNGNYDQYLCCKHYEVPCPQNKSN